MKSSNHLAIIDMGTNTFHLLVVSASDNILGFTEVHRDRHYVLLAEDGIETIGDQSLRRAKKAIDEFQSALQKFNDCELVIVGTEALRVATNGNIINDYCKVKLGKSPLIISGDREAELIYKGNELLVNTANTPYLIMDIGGGSTEFILADQSGILFSQSYPLGVTKMYNAFNDDDPITTKAIDLIENHVEESLRDLSQVMEKCDLISLIGASGSFEVLATVLFGDIPSDSIVDVDIKDFQKLASKAITATIEERRMIEGIPESRVKLIQVAFIMMRKVISMFSPDKIGVSPFAIKEGLIAEWLSSD